jgi:hypothetical protein
MSRNSVSVTGIAVLLGLTLACTSKSSTPLTPTAPPNGTSGPAADGSTLKVSAPTPQSPVNDQKPSTGPATLVVAPVTAAFVPAVAVQYRFQIFNSAGTLVDDSLENVPRYEVEAELVVNSRYTWQARAEAASGVRPNDVGPWSPRASFTAPESAFLDDEILDPLTSGRTVGQQRGGVFLPGQGWQSLALDHAISYDLSEPCWEDCTLEFDITNIGEKEGQCCEKDLKFVSMGDAASFGGFGSFRNSPWKMHFIQRADHSTGLEIIWRNGRNAESGDPGDHRIKLLSTPIEFRGSQVYHVKLEWATTGFRISINDIEVMRDGWDYEYRPPVHRISLGCYPRSESFIGAIYRNVRLKRG